ncbi:hypothetical protein [Limnofasciculus baicalensis]|uniref:Uncharacterized protein n=1 Tax=Limnofasciculus baicalensis BBK-W-15 TaxID=2699891 RepID=A0AAE3KMT4_9CYAN|nr:hypothetical protein [Limnofasciculus baicalensis]MCP2729554.1 hypothetical protein [Limnofasciculus baicalensis BBK-W-15]
MLSREELVNLKLQKTFHLVSLGGVARSLTTVVAKMLATQSSRLSNREGFWFDGSLNEEFSWGENRIERGYDLMLQIVRDRALATSREQRNLLQVPIHIIAKNNSHHFSRKSWESFLTLADCQFLSIRNPALTFPSLINKTIEKKINDKEYLAESRLANLNKDDSRLKAMQSEVLKIIQTPKNERDFAVPALECRDFKIDLHFHRCIDREMFLELWSELKDKMTDEDTTQYAQELGFSSWGEMVEKFSHFSLKQLYELPELLRQPLEGYRTGWRGLEKAIDAAKTTQTPIFCYDATDVQLFPEQFFQAAHQAMERGGISPATDRTPVSFYDSQESQKVGLAASFHKAMQSDRLHQPLQQPIPLYKLPTFLHPLVLEAFEIYIRLLLDRSTMWIPDDFDPWNLAQITLSNGKTVLETDPVYTYSRAIAANSTTAKTQLKQQIRQQFSEFETYYNVIDATANQLNQC